MNKEKKYLIYGISLMLLVLMGASLAYFVTDVTSENRDLTISTDDLRIVFTDTDGSITGTNIEPGWSKTKTFSVENKSSSEYEYDIVIKDLVNTFKTTGYLVYKITSTSGYNMTGFKDVPKSSTATDSILAYSVKIPSKSIHSYIIEIKYINDEEASQNIDMNSILTGDIYVKEGTEKPCLTFETGTLGYKILESNVTISERTDFSVANTSNTTGTIYKTKSSEDNECVYYYSGNTTNNWVYFGGYYWRIIRTNEDGSVRLLYSGTSTDTTEGYMTSSKAFNNTVSESRYVGYMYGGNTSLSSNRENTISSVVKTYLESWYETNLLTNYDKYISKTAIYCNDRSVGSGEWVNTGNTFNFGAFTRLHTNKAPSYKCGTNASGGLFESTQAVEDKFSVSEIGEGNGNLTYGIALMTADEVVFAGGKTNSSLTSPYAYYYTNSLGSSITGTNWWWLMSPSRWLSTGYSYVFGVVGSDNPGKLNHSDVDYDGTVRGVISIDKCAKFTGTGTVTDPFALDAASSTCS